MLIPRHLLVGSGFLLILAARHAGGGEEGDERARVIFTWKALASIHFQSTEEIHRNADGVDLVRVSNFGWNDHGLSSATFDQTFEGVLKRQSEQWDDGTRLFRVDYFGDGSGVKDHVTIDPTRNEPGRFGGWMFLSLWAVLPGGRTIGSILEHGGRLETRNGRLYLETNFDQDSVSCELDREHGYTIKSLNRAGNGVVNLSVDRHENVAGQWVPSEGHGVYRTTQRGVVSTSNFAFHIDQIKINDLADQKISYRLPTTPGVLIQDRINRQQWAVGGRLERIKLKEAHSKVDMSRGFASTLPLIAPQAPPRSMIALVLIGLAGVSGIAGSIVCLWQFRHARRPL